MACVMSDIQAAGQTRGRIGELKIMLLWSRLDGSGDDAEADEF